MHNKVEQQLTPTYIHKRLQNYGTEKPKFYSLFIHTLNIGTNKGLGDISIILITNAEYTHIHNIMRRFLHKQRLFTRESIH